MHRKSGSPGMDYIPMQVRIWRRLPNGTRSENWRQGFFLPVTIVNGQPLRRPVARTFRQASPVPNCKCQPALVDWTSSRPIFDTFVNFFLPIPTVKLMQVLKQTGNLIQLLTVDVPLLTEDSEKIPSEFRFYYTYF